MNLTVQVKLEPDLNQVQSLFDTMVEFNKAANFVSRLAFKRKIFHPIGLHHLKIGNQILYYHLREKYPSLSAMHIQLIFRKVADAYKSRQSRKKNEKILVESGSMVIRKYKVEKPCSFRLDSAIPYNNNNINTRRLTLDYENRDKSLNKISISTIYGRCHITFVIGDHQRRLLSNNTDPQKIRECRLIRKDGTFYIDVPIEQHVSTLNEEPVNYIGVDLGVSNIATTSTGRIFSSESLDAKRTHFKERRRELQKVGTKSAKRALRRNNRKESNFCKNINHNISKSIIVEAEGTGCGIVIEYLTNIRNQTTVRKQQRYRHHSWSFSQLRTMIAYKAIMAGVMIKVVDPSYTSQRCGKCGHISRANRKSQYRFSCVLCDHDAHADYNAACNLAELGRSTEYSYRKVYDTVAH